MPVDMTYLQFERRAVHDAAASSKEGRYVAKNVDFAILTPSGGVDCVEREITPELLELWSSQGFGNRVKHYEAWKMGQEPPVDGHSIKEWPVASPAEIKMCIENNIRTVEALAGANDTALRRIGIGGVSLQNKAKTWLADDKGKAVERISSLETKVKGMEEELTRLYEENEALRSRAGDPPRQTSKKNRAA